MGVAVVGATIGDRPRLPIESYDFLSLRRTLRLPEFGKLAPRAVSTSPGRKVVPVGRLDQSRAAPLLA